jgi:hypothetical protein
MGDTIQLIQLPDGTWAAVSRSMTYGEAAIIVLLAALVLIKLYELWRQR